MEWLQKEVEEWKNVQIITEHQAQSILSRYGLVEQPNPEDEKKSRLIAVVSILGSFLIGVGAILFVASHWDEIPDSLRIILLVGTTFLTYYGGWRVRFETQSHPRLGHALLFLGSLFVGATIFLTAQIFNVNAHAHWLILLWVAAISPLGYAFNSTYILGLNIFTFALWTFSYVTSPRDVNVFLVLIVYLLLGISLYGLGLIHNRIKGYTVFSHTYQRVGLVLILASHFYFSLETPFEHYIQEGITTNWRIHALLVLFSITSIAAVVYSGALYKRLKKTRHEACILFVAFLGFVAALLVSILGEHISVITTTDYGYTYTTVTPQIAAVLFIIFNALFFGLSVGSILLGYHKGVTFFVNTGMFFFVLGVIHLYFTTVYRFLPRALAFIVGGLILLGGGWYFEKKRRSLIEDMEAEVSDHE